MAGESAAWKTTADGILASFGDVVRKGVVLVESDTSTYNTVTGTMTKTSVQTQTRVVPVEFKFKLFGRDKYQEEDVTLLVRGSDFAVPPPVGSRIAVYNTAETAVQHHYVVIQVQSSDAGTGAYFFLHVRKASRTFTVT